MDKHLHDLKETWPIILASAGISLFFGFAFIFLLKCCAGVIIWGSIVLYIALLTAMGYLFYD